VSCKLTTDITGSFYLLDFKQAGTVRLDLCLKVIERSNKYKTHAGQGKSTLLKLLVGILKPTKGTVAHHPRLRFGYYDQLSVEALSKSEPARLSSVEHFTEQLKSQHQLDVDQGTTRAFLGSFGLQGKTATNPIGTLSGGQKANLQTL
jgi:ATPase subunit of ABC transporter with duplicated ATPase domains